MRSGSRAPRRTFGYATATDTAAALQALTDPDTWVIAGGTELVNWMKEGIATPARLVDIRGLPLGDIDADATGLRLGALARMSDVAAHPVVAADYPVLAESLLRAASPQLRNIIDVPAGGHTRRSHYLKVRERVSYEFAVVSAAAALTLDDGTITEARLALGGVAARPWRLPEAEVALRGVALTDLDRLRAAVATSFRDARPLAGNAFKVELAQRAAVRALRTAGGRS